MRADIAGHNVIGSVYVESGAGNLIGGTTPQMRNVLAGNTVFNQGEGEVRVGGNAAPTGTVIQGNYLGVNAAGTAIVNTQSFQNIPGISITSHAVDTLIGGDDAADDVVDGNIGARNVISGNGYGILLNPASGAAVMIDNTRVLGNLVGLDATGSFALGNFGDGITGGNGASSDNVVIGGATAGAGNVISGNAQIGCSVSALHMTIRGNLIGTDTIVLWWLLPVAILVTSALKM